MLNFIDIVSNYSILIYFVDFDHYINWGVNKI